MSANTLIWIVPPTVLAKNVGAMRARLRPTVSKHMIALASDLESWAKANHRWRNRTGAAEATFTVTIDRGGLSLVARHGVYYGVYLEFKHGGRWGVIRDLLAYARGPAQQAMQAALRETMGT